VFLVAPAVFLTPTAYGAENMSTCVLLIHRPASLSVYSVQLKRMFAFGSVGFCTAGWTRPPVVSLKTSFWP
jgi:hypothetical protein